MSDEKSRLVRTLGHIAWYDATWVGRNSENLRDNFVLDLTNYVKKYERNGRR